MHSAVEQQDEEEQLRNQHRQLTVELLALPEGDSRQKDISKRRKSIVIRLRQIIYDEASDVCSVPDCITRATVTVDNKQWCERHAAQ